MILPVDLYNMPPKLPSGAFFIAGIARFSILKIDLYLGGA